MELCEKGVYTFPGFLSPEECAAYRELALNPPAAATDFTSAGVFKNKKWVDEALADLFFKRIAGLVASTPLALRANNLIMTGHYESGEQFNMHTDTGLFFDRAAREKSRWTLLIYLNDDFEGGHTLFFDDAWQQTHDITPEAGKALLFDIDLWHRGCEVFRGTKQWIGCEIIGAF